ncbi:MAG: cystathionine gamma-synthase, partial [Gammaproteobacteria bacterium]|nr:cystathionine gamma-synthase [Gammaproteobacteria bacterium]
MVTGFNRSLTVRLAALAALTLAQASPLGLRAAAAQASGDRATRAALALAAHPARGAALFGRLCSRCHGAAGQGDPALAIPE